MIADVYTGICVVWIFSVCEMDCVFAFFCPCFVIMLHHLDVPL